MERTVDLAAVSRVAKRVELKSIRLIAISAQCDANAQGPALKPEVSLDCKLGNHGRTSLEVVCDYSFTGITSGEAPAIESAIQYLLLYEIGGVEAPSVEDMSEFARANGALHSWPFAREFLFGLTSRMGFPPYTLPVIHFSANTEPPAVSKSE